MSKRTAFVHCRVAPGGAFRVLLDIIADQQFDQASLFTLISRDRTLKTRHGDIEVVSSLPRWVCQIFFFFQDHRVFFLSWIFDYRNLMFFYPVLTKVLSKKIERYVPDSVIISSFAIAKNISIPAQASSILYLHSPNQYVHSHHDEYLQNLSGAKKWLFQLVSNRIRKRDLRPRSYDRVYANSHYSGSLALDYYGLRAEVIYPRLPIQLFSKAVQTKAKDYFVYVGRVVTLVKELDRIIRMFNRNGEKLIIIGSGPDEHYLKKIASDTILFVGRIEDDDERYSILREARGLINITKESFGLSVAESLLLGVPVFGYSEGATTELVDEDSGILAQTKDESTLDHAFSSFVAKDFDRKAIQNRARNLFSEHFSLSSS